MSANQRARRDELLLLLSTGARPGVAQLEQLTRAARGRPIRWLEYTRDLSVEHTWTLVDDQLVASADELGDPELSAAVATEAATDEVKTEPVDPGVAKAERAARRREAVRRPVRAVVRTSIRLAPEAVRRSAKTLPEPIQDRLRRMAARPARGVTPGSLLAAALLNGPLSVDKPALVVAIDRAAAAGAWYLVNHRPEITAVNALDPAIRYLDLVAERGMPTLQWAPLFGAGQEHDVLAALPALDAMRPRVVLVEVDPDDLAPPVSGLLAGGQRDIVVVRAEPPHDPGEDAGPTPLLRIGRRRLDVHLQPSTPSTGLAQLDLGPEEDDTDPYAAVVAELHADLLVSAPTPTPHWGTVRAVGPDPAAVAAALERLPEATADDAAHLLIAPANYAGQSAAWSRAVEEHAPGAVSRNLSVGHADAPFTFPADFPVAIGEWQRPRVRARLTVEAVLPSTHVLLEAMRPIVAAADPTGHPGAWDFHLGRADVDELRASGRRVALLFHGSEVRRPAPHAEAYDWSPFRDPRHAGPTARMAGITERVHALIEGFDGPVFVSTPDLLDDLPGATWLPVVVGPDFFRPAPPALTGPRPVVVHAPSSPLLKGTAVIDPVLEALDAEGLIEYRRLSTVPSAFVGDFIREADVVADQIVLGNPGVLAAEALAAGRLVVAHVAEHVRARCPLPLPVVEATPPTFEAVMRQICADREAYHETARQGSEFAAQVHSGGLSAGVLGRFLAT